MNYCNEGRDVACLPMIYCSPFIYQLELDGIAGRSQEPGIERVKEKNGDPPPTATDVSVCKLRVPALCMACRTSCAPRGELHRKTYTP